MEGIDVGKRDQEHVRYVYFKNLTGLEALYLKNLHTCESVAINLVIA